MDTELKPKIVESHPFPNGGYAYTCQIGGVAYSIHTSPTGEITSICGISCYGADLLHDGTKFHV